MKQQRMHSDEEDAPLTEHLLEHFAGWYLICVVAVQALETARLLHARREAAKSNMPSTNP